MWPGWRTMRSQRSEKNQEFCVLSIMHGVQKFPFDTHTHTNAYTHPRILNNAINVWQTLLSLGASNGCRAKSNARNKGSYTLAFHLAVERPNQSTEFVQNAYSQARPNTRFNFTWTQKFTVNHITSSGNSKSIYCYDWRLSMHSQHTHTHTHTH